jgi:four helix bundle protein
MEQRQSENAIAEKSFKFAVRIVRLSHYLGKEKKEFVLSKQVLKSGTAIGALVSESRYAQSRADFLNKLSIALKEANETLYRIRLLHETDYLSPSMYRSLEKDGKEILSLLVSITKTLKESPGNS